MKLLTVKVPSLHLTSGLGCNSHTTCWGHGSLCEKDLGCPSRVPVVEVCAPTLTVLKQLLKGDFNFLLVLKSRDNEAIKANNE